MRLCRSVCNKPKAREVKYNCFNCKRIPVNTLNEALKQATVTLQNTTKKDIVDFREKESHSFDQKGVHMKENRKGAYLHRDKVSCSSKKQSVYWESSSFKTFKKVLQTAVNKDQAFDVPFIFFLFLSKDSNLKKKGTTVGDDSHHPSYMVAAV